MSEVIIVKVIEQLRSMPNHMQRQVLDYAKALKVKVPVGTSGSELSSFAGAIPVEDLQAMQEAIEQGCEQIDHNEW